MTIPERVYRPDVVLRARQADKNNEFQRAVVQREPLDLYYDAIVMECGHTSLMMARALSDPKGQQCSDCCKAWMDQQQAAPAAITEA